MLDLEWAARVDVVVDASDLDAAGRLKAEACSLWAIMALETAAREGAQDVRLVSLSVEMGPAECFVGQDIAVMAETNKRSRALAFLSAKAEDEVGRMLFTATGVFGLSSE
jgi:nucleotide-binding universal stress UspA family protein